MHLFLMVALPVKIRGTNTGDNSSGVIYDYEIPDDVDIDIDVDDAPTE